MNFFKTAALFALSLSTLGSTFATEQNDQPYKRIITTIHERLNTGPSNFLDPNHQQMIATGLYDANEAQTLTAQAIAQFNVNYGIDFGAVIPDAAGIRAIPGVGVMIPYIDGLEEDIILVTDTENPQRAKSGKWFSLQVGQAVAFTQSGVFPGGVNAGASFSAGDNWVVVDYNLLKSDSNWNKPKNREKFKVYTYEIGKGIRSQWNQTQNVLSLSITDQDQTEGFGVSGVVTVKSPAGVGAFFTTVTDTFFWHN